MKRGHERSDVIPSGELPAEIEKTEGEKGKEKIIPLTEKTELNFIKRSGYATGKNW